MLVCEKVLGMLSQEAINEFKKLYKEQYGEDLNDFVASEAANRLIRMMDVVYRPIPKAWEERYNEIKKEQEAAPEDKKIDYVKHLVADAKVTEWKAQNDPPKRRKQSNNA